MRKLTNKQKKKKRVCWKDITELIKNFQEQGLKSLGYEGGNQER